MSKEQAKKFIEKLQQDEKLQEEMKALWQETIENMDSSVIELGVRHGYTFNQVDLQAAQQEWKQTFLDRNELDESDLERVAGGRLSGDWGVSRIIIDCIVSHIEGEGSRWCS